MAFAHADPPLTRVLVRTIHSSGHRLWHETDLGSSLSSDISWVTWASF